MRWPAFVAFIVSTTVICCLGEVAVGDIYVSGAKDGGPSGLFRIDPTSGAQSALLVFAEAADGVAIDRSGAPLLLDGFAQRVVRYDPVSQTSTSLQLPTNFGGLWIAVDSAGRYFVGGSVPHPSDGISHVGIDVIDPVRGSQDVLATDLPGGASGIAVADIDRVLIPGANLYELTSSTGAMSIFSPGALTSVTAAHGLVFGTTSDAVVQIDPSTGARRVLSSGGFLTQARALAIGPQGDLDVVDGMYLGGAIIRVDPRNGTQSVISSGGILGQTVGIGEVIPEPSVALLCVMWLVTTCRRRAPVR